MKTAAQLLENIVSEGITSLLKSTTETPDTYISSALEESKVLKQASGILSKLSGWLDSGLAEAVYYIQLWDGDPSGGGTLVWSLPVSHDGSSDTFFSIDFAPFNIGFSNDIRVYLSTDALSFTGAGTNAVFKSIYK